MSNTVNEVEATTVSHSQAKRNERKKEVAAARRNAKIVSAIGYIALAVLAALVVWAIVLLVGKQMDKVTPNSDYSTGLDSNGYISGVKASSMVNLPDYKNITVPKAEIEYTDMSIDSEIDSMLAGYKEVSTEEGLKVKDGDTIDLAYVGTIDGVEFEGGKNDSYSLTIGSGTFIDGFEQQLIGAENGSDVVVNVTFPDDYAGGDSEVAGKDAVFNCHINGIFVIPEFTDEFVAANLSDKATTAEGYREYLKTTHEKENIAQWVDTYLADNTTVKSYPKKYVKALKGIQMYDDQQSYEYMNQMYLSYYGSSVYDSFEDYVGTSMEEYYQTLKTKAQDAAKINMAYQAIVELEGATVDADYYKAELDASGQGAAYYDSEVATAGEGFTLQQAIRLKAIQIMADSAVVQ